MNVIHSFGHKAAEDRIYEPRLLLETLNLVFVIIRNCIFYLNKLNYSMRTRVLKRILVAYKNYCLCHAQVC